MRRVDAVLLYDSARPEASGVSRSGIRIDRTLVFRADEHTVDMVIHGGTGNVGFLLGQVIHERDGKPVEGAAVRFRGEDVESRTDEHGQFTLTCEKPGGARELNLTMGDVEVSLLVSPVDDS